MAQIAHYLTLLLFCVQVQTGATLMQRAAPPMRGYVLFPDKVQRKAAGIEVRLVRGYPERFLYSVRTEISGLFAFPEYLTSLLDKQIPNAPDTIYFYINLEGYEPVMFIAKSGMNVIMLHAGPSDPNMLPTEYDAPPLTRLEAMRKELVDLYSEPAVGEYEAGLRDSLKHKEGNAVDHYRRAVRYAPTFFDAFLQLGFSYKELKQSAEAENAFRKTIEIRPDVRTGFNGTRRGSSGQGRRRSGCRRL